MTVTLGIIFSSLGVIEWSCVNALEVRRRKREVKDRNCGSQRLRGRTDSRSRGRSEERAPDFGGQWDHHL
jgi:hypothetical protein